jgi:hypothetical protein
VTEKKASEKLAELRERSPLLASIFMSSPLNRRALDLEQNALDDATADATAIEHIDRLARAKATHSIELEVMRARGHHVAAGIYEQTHAVELREESERLAGCVDEDEDDSLPPAA